MTQIRVEWCPRSNHCSCLPIICRMKSKIPGAFQEPPAPGPLKCSSHVPCFSPTRVLFPNQWYVPCFPDKLFNPSPTSLYPVITLHSLYSVLLNHILQDSVSKPPLHGACPSCPRGALIFCNTQRTGRVDYAQYSCDLFLCKYSLLKDHALCVF